MSIIDNKRLIPLGSIWFHAHDAEQRRRKEWVVRSVSCEAVVLVANEVVRCSQTFDNVSPFGGPLEMTLSPEVLLLTHIATGRRALRPPEWGTEDTPTPTPTIRTDDINTIEMCVKVHGDEFDWNAWQRVREELNRADLRTPPLVTTL